MPIRTPDIPGLWGWPPDPPILNTQLPVDAWFGHTLDARLANPPGAWPGAGTSTRVQATSRHPLTGAPVWERGRPPLDPLRPFERHQTVPNGRNPITNALLYFRPGQTIPPGWEIT